MLEVTGQPPPSAVLPATTPSPAQELSPHACAHAGGAPPPLLLERGRKGTARAAYLEGERGEERVAHSLLQEGREESRP
jgi:hypothetical protein